MSDNRPRAWLAILLLSPAISGCLDEQETPDQELPGSPVWFHEPAAELENLTTMEKAEASRLKSPCGFSDLQVPEEAYGRPLHLSTLDRLMRACSNGGLVTYSQENVDQWVEDGSAASRLSDVRTKATAALAKARVALDGWNASQSIVDWELAAYLTKKHWTDFDIHQRTVLSAWKGFNKTGNAHTLQLAFVNENDVTEESRLVMQWMAYLPLMSTQSCLVGEERWVALEAEVRQDLAAAFAQAKETAKPDDVNHLGTYTGRLVNDFGPGINYSLEHGWRPALIWYSAALDWFIAAHSDTVPPLPSREDAYEFSNRTLGRVGTTIIADYLVVPFYDYVTGIPAAYEEYGPLYWSYLSQVEHLVRPVDPLCSPPS
jgi:hypothetical protein